MIRRYDSGAAFLAENQAFLDTKPQISAFMALDAPLLEKTDKINYAARCEKDGKTLLAMKVEPYHLQLFGDTDCAGELLDFLVRGGYEIQNYLSEKTLGDAAAREMEARFGMRYEEALAMRSWRREPSSSRRRRRLKRRMKTIWTKSMRAWSDFWSNATCRTSRTARR